MATAGSAWRLPRLVTGDIHVDGGIAPGTPDRIAGGVFLLAGGIVDLVRVRGTVATHGANDMVVDNGGTGDTWLVDGKLTSCGPSGVASSRSPGCPGTAA